MEERKLIKFGKSAFCITIPHSWLKKNNILKGDVVYVQETLRNSLELMPFNKSSNESNELVIDISDKSTDEIIQLLLSTYLNGYTIITLKGPTSGKVAFIREHVHEFIAAEIMEVTTDKIVIHIFWDIHTINLDSIIRRIGHITKSIFNETIELLDTEINENDIIEKGFEVQRQVLLARRAIKYALNNSHTAEKFKFTSLELLYISYIIYFFGMIADYILKVTKIITSSKLNKLKDSKDKEAIEGLKYLINHTSEYYNKLTNSYYQNDKSVKFVFSEFEDFEKSIDKYKENNKQLWVPLVSEFIKMLMYKTKETELTMISMENAPK